MRRKEGHFFIHITSSRRGHIVSMPRLQKNICTLRIREYKYYYFCVPPRGFEPPTKSLGNFCSVHTELRGRSVLFFNCQKFSSEHFRDALSPPEADTHSELRGRSGLFFNCQKFCPERFRDALSPPEADTHSELQGRSL